MNKDNLFHLIEIDSKLEGYFIDVDMQDIYSTRTGPLRRLSKSKPGGVRYEYWSLYNRRAGRSETYNITKFRQNLEQATEFIEWRNEMIRSRARAGSSGRVQAGSSDRVLGGYVLSAVTTGGVLSYSKTPKVHSTEAEARAEAERLAKKNVGVILVVTKIIGSVVAGGVTWS